MSFETGKNLSMPKFVMRKPRKRKAALQDNAQNGHPAVAVRRVLIFAYDNGSIVDRLQVLAENGYEVRISATLASAVMRVRRKASTFDFLVIGYAVPQAERLKLARVYRDANPAGQVIFLYKNGIRNTNPSVAALLSINGTNDNLLTAIRSIERLRSNANHATGTASQHSGQKGRRRNV
jgi:hypothetical protein